MYYNRFKSIRIASLEFLRGQTDARSGHSPVALVGYYYDGYMSVPYWSRNRGTNDN